MTTPSIADQKRELAEWAEGVIATDLLQIPECRCLTCKRIRKEITLAIYVKGEMSWACNKCHDSGKYNDPHAFLPRDCYCGRPARITDLWRALGMEG